MKREECDVGGRLLECLGVLLLFSFCKHDVSKYYELRTQIRNKRNYKGFLTFWHGSFTFKF